MKKIINYIVIFICFVLAIVAAKFSMRVIGWHRCKSHNTAVSVLRFASFSKHYLANIADLEHAEKFVLSRSKELLAGTKVPMDVKDKLDTFFMDSDVKALFVACEKKPFIAYYVIGMAPREVSYLQRYRLETDKTYSELCKKIGEKYGIEVGLEYKNEENRKYTVKGTVLGSSDDSYILTLQKSLPNYVLKISKRDWIDNKGLVAFPYQEISRIFYNMELNKFVQEKGLANFIYTHPEYLYNIPGTDLELCDNNYVVVTPKIIFPTKAENIKTFKSLFNKKDILELSQKIDIFVKQLLQKGVKSQAEIIKAINPADINKNLTTALVYSIKLLGLWDISAENIFVLNVDGQKKIFFANKERPGLGGGAMKNFFHQNIEEIQSNGICGINGLLEKVL